MISFGELIAKQRKKLNLTQKQIAAGIKQDDGKPISAQYLNDIEHGRRGAPPDYVIAQLARLLRLQADVLYFRAGRLPPDIRKRPVSDQQAAATYRSVCRELRRPKKNLKMFSYTLMPIDSRGITAVQHRVRHLCLLIC